MPQPNRKPGRTRRQEIAEAALSIIGTRGLTKLTTTRIADEIGLTSGALFRHFESLEEILIAAVDHGLAEIEKTFPSSSLAPDERLLRFASQRVDLLSNEPGIAFLLRSDQAFLALPEEAVARLTKTVKRSREFVLNTLREGTEKGSFRDDIDNELLLYPVLGTIHSLIGTTGPAGKAGKEKQDRKERALLALLRMLAPFYETTDE